MLEFEHWMGENVAPHFTPARVVNTIIWTMVILFAICLLFGAIAALIRYPSETAALRMVDNYEQTGIKVGFKQGWKLGWDRRAFQLWLLDLILFALPVLLLLALIGGMVYWISVSAINGNDNAIGASVATTFLCLVPFVMVSALGMAFLRLLRQFFSRAIALEGADVRAAFRSGWATFKHHWKSALLMWVVVLGLNIGLGIAMLIAFLPLLVVCIIPAIAGVFVAGIPGALIGWLVSLFSPVWVAVLVGVIIFLPIFFLVTFSPFTLIQGWITIFESSTWTLAYREMRTAGNLGLVGQAPAAELSAPAA
jgi:hypothetical protein